MNFSKLRHVLVSVIAVFISFASGFYISNSLEQEAHIQNNTTIDTQFGVIAAWQDRHYLAELENKRLKTQITALEDIRDTAVSDINILIDKLRGACGLGISEDAPYCHGITVVSR